MLAPGVILIFIDGLGIGPRDPINNPLDQPDLQVLKVFSEALGPFPRDGVCLPTETRLGVAGLPQSATNQTTLYTGLNAAKAVGGHLPGFPNGSLKELIAPHSIFQKLVSRGLSVTFANTYTPRFFAEMSRWKSVTTVMTESASIPLRRIGDLVAGRALYMDFTNRALQDQGEKVPLRTPEEAAEVLVNLSRDFHFTLYEYFLTDLVGHRGTIQEARTLVRSLDSFLGRVVQLADLERRSLVVTSDHGNIENMGHPRHTVNLVPTLLWGPIQNLFLEGHRPLALTDLAPTIERFLSSPVRDDEETKPESPGRRSAAG